MVADPSWTVLSNAPGTQGAGAWEFAPTPPIPIDLFVLCAGPVGSPRFLLDLREGVHDELRTRLMDPRLERFIGVIYRPETERWSHYSECILAGQFDAKALTTQLQKITDKVAKYPSVKKVEVK